MQSYEKEHLERLRPYLAECTVLLKSNGDFPLREAGQIAAYGSGIRHTVKGGTGSGEVNSRYYVNVEEGLCDAGFTITTGAWLDAYDLVLKNARKLFIQGIQKEARRKHTLAVLIGMGAVMPEPEYEIPLQGEGDTAIYVLSRNSGEGNDRKPVKGDILLSDTEVRDILALQSVYKKFMLVINAGGPVDLSPVNEKVENILVLSQLGVETGAALADILLGKQTPSGKLTTTWAKWETYPQIGDFGFDHDTSYKEGIYVGYRYFDTAKVTPMYPFGYGLSYTSFEYQVLRVQQDETVRTLFAIDAKVTNTGAYSGKETVQVYVSVPEGKLDQPYQVLAGFAKTQKLGPGESEVVTVAFDLRDLASYDAETAHYVLEEGKYIVRVGVHSRKTEPAAVIELTRNASIRWARTLLGNSGFEDWKPEKKAVSDKENSVKPENTPTEGMDAVLEEVSDMLPKFRVLRADIVRVKVQYHREYEIDDLVKSCSDEELARMNVGYFNNKAGALSMIGEAGNSVAGAAGETAHILEKKGVPALILADGPAGVRVSARYYEDEKGAHAIGQELFPESMTELMGKPVRAALRVLGGNSKAPKGAQIQTHYATAIPIGTALAQSWNLEFARECGDIVGDEAKRFGVHLWLAPALNIHRSILCGRNFEYFSEDPHVSGKMAAALTKGVQAHPGVGVTIKHFAANNQEHNRYNNSSHVSERAMRDIYLKGFEICIREAQPYAVMTSYNLLNDRHTSQHRSLIEGILRCEWGFEGIVMTDWIIGIISGVNARHPQPDAARIARAGSELVMPGSPNDYRKILKGLKTGRVSRQQLEINATSLIRMIRKLTEL